MLSITVLYLFSPQTNPVTMWCTDVTKNQCMLLRDGLVLLKKGIPFHI